VKGACFMSVFSHIPKSTYIKGIEWLSDRIPYPDHSVKGDTYPVTWADDDAIYTSSGDPLWGGKEHGLDVERLIGGPTDYRIDRINNMDGYIGWGGNGPKPTGMICVDGILYLAFQNLKGARKPPHSLSSQHGSDAYIVYSANKGFFWVPSFENIKEPMFPGHKFGGPSFVNFGKNNENAKDDFVYAVSSDQWDNGSNIRLGRVPKDKITIKESWEWVCAFTPSYEAVWSHDLNESIPILSIHKWMGVPEMVYLASIDRYLMFSWRFHKDFSPEDGTDLLIFEAPEPYGPFSLVHVEEYWEGKNFTPYCPRLPLKWVEPDGVTCWLQFSGSWGVEGQKNGYYRSNVRRMRLIMK